MSGMQHARSQPNQQTLQQEGLPKLLLSDSTSPGMHDPWHASKSPPSFMPSGAACNVVPSDSLHSFDGPQAQKFMRQDRPFRLANFCNFLAQNANFGMGGSNGHHLAGLLNQASPADASLVASNVHVDQGAAQSNATAVGNIACSANPNACPGFGFDAFQARRQSLSRLNQLFQQQQTQPQSQSQLMPNNNYTMAGFEPLANASTDSGLVLARSVLGGAGAGVESATGLRRFEHSNASGANASNGSIGWDGVSGLGGLNGMGSINRLSGFDGFGSDNDFQADFLGSDSSAPGRRFSAASSNHRDGIDMHRTVSQPTSPSPSQVSVSGSASTAVCASTAPSLPLSMANDFVPQKEMQMHGHKQLSLNNSFSNSISGSGSRHSSAQEQQQQQQQQRFGSSNTKKWIAKYRELVHFVQQHGHSLVPLDYKINPSLAHWVKRQRCQHKAKMANAHSTLTLERQQMLEDLDFCWDSHRAAWEERFRQLNGFKCQYGHCNVPSKYSENRSLAIWVKCQRRQYKLQRAGKKSNLNDERISKLSQMGFVWTPREVRSSHSPAAPSIR